MPVADKSKGVHETYQEWADRCRRMVAQQRADEPHQPPLRRMESRGGYERRIAALETALSCCLGALKVLAGLVKDEKRRAGLEKTIQQAERALF